MATDAPCTACGAAPGEPCVTPSRRTKTGPTFKEDEAGRFREGRFHRPRLVLAVMLDDRLLNGYGDEGLAFLMGRD